MTQPSTDWVLNPLFEDVKNPDELRAWLMRAYFNPTKHSGEQYYRPDITKANILEYISVAKNKFPQTPLSIVEVWSVLPSLREGLRSVIADDDSKETPGIYTKGEKTLALIGKAIGGVTPTMVNKISDGAVLKLTSMMKALNSENEWLSREAKDKIENAVLTASENCADALLMSETPDDFLRHLEKMEVISQQDFAICDDTEREGIQELIALCNEGCTQAELEDIIIQDLGKAVNIFNIAQLMVARQIYPAGKRGRPKASGK